MKQTALLQLQLLDLARQRIAPPAEEPRRFLAMAIGARQRHLDQRLLELGQRRVEQRRLAGLQLSFGPACEHPGPVRRALSRRTRTTEVGRDVFGRDDRTRRRHGQAARGIDELADVAGPVECLQRVQRIGVDMKNVEL